VRGREGSEARHISTQQFYRELFAKNEDLKENIGILQGQKTEANQELSRIKGEIKTGKLKNSAVDVATSAIESIGSVLGTSKVRRQQLEIEELKPAGFKGKLYSSEYKRHFETEHSVAEIKIEPNEPT
jgi:hypothetical protein